MNILQKFEAKQLEELKQNSKIPAFSVGDTVCVNVKIREGDRERIQAYEGVCIARSGSDINASFTVRKISYGEGVERVFPLFSPRIDSIDLVRRGSVRRAKLYYLRDLRGKSARISERTTGHGLQEASALMAEEKEARKIAKKEAKARKEKAREEKKAAPKKEKGKKVKAKKAAPEATTEETSSKE
ncbi:MAG: 50S ribosomal protein L19 [Alphaproteobacteria bacterium CG_4_9_14_3_um_filter_47_13]|nr:MAG: 50S ribosomal protein L19 [Alphaproteobacteria bacterium CG_4_9_14_3_um_filter_47_13]